MMIPVSSVKECKAIPVCDSSESPFFEVTFEKKKKKQNTWRATRKSLPDAIKGWWLEDKHRHMSADV